MYDQALLDFENIKYDADVQSTIKQIKELMKSQINSAEDGPSKISKFQ